MSNLVWPSSLPQRPTVGGYQERFAETTLRTTMDAGTAKVRRRFTAAPRQIEATFKVNAAQTGILKTFFEDMTAGGALPVDWTHPREGTPATFRFLESPRVAAITGTLFTVAVKLEHLP
jgi:hypothetical protein